MISIRNMSKSSIFNSVNIDIPLGITFLKGKNGSGKTTLLDCIAGIDHKYLGEIAGNEDAVYLNQTLYFYGRLKGKDLIQFLMGLNGDCNAMACYEKNMRLNRKRAMIRSLYDKPVGKLSGGELKLFYFSIITAMDRTWYLFDEPFAQVDEEGKGDMIDVFKKLLQEGKNVVITNHEEFFVKEFPEMTIIDMDNL